MKAAIALSASLIALGLPALSFAATTIDLGNAAYFSILTKAGISSTGVSQIVGNIGVSPISSAAITGFNLVKITPTYARSSLVSGNVYAANYAAPTPAQLTVDIGDMQKAYADGAARTNPTKTELGAGNIGGLTIRPGLYKWGTGVNIPTDVTLSGGPNGVWIFQVAGTLTVASGKKVVLAGGALNRNIFWVVAGKTTLGTTAVLHGIVLDKTAIVMKTGSKLYGRAFAQTAVTLDTGLVWP